MKYTPPVGGAPGDPYVDGNPSTGTPGSPVPAAAIEDDQRELDELITFAGLVPSAADLTQVRQAVVALVNGATAPNLIVGELEYVGAAAVRLAPGTGGDVVVEVDGVLSTQAGAALQFDLPGDLLSPEVEQASTWYHCYVQDGGGSLVAVISATAPEATIGNKIGYHPTQTDARYVGCFFNDGGSNIQRFESQRQGSTRIHTMLEAAPLVASYNADVDPSVALDLSSDLPSTAREALLAIWMDSSLSNNARLIVTPQNVSRGTAIAAIPRGDVALEHEKTDSVQNEWKSGWVALDSAGQATYAYFDPLGAESTELYVRGFRERV